MQLLTVAVSASAAYGLYSVGSAVVKSYQNSSKARSLKCEEPPFQKNRYPLGIDNLLRALAADKAQLFPVDTIQRIADTGAITFRYSILGSRNIFTADEKNIQAVLATQFSDFGRIVSNRI